MDSVNLWAVYCDDIRQESGGKFSYMGVYNSDMVLLELPALIAKLCIQVVVRLPINTEAQNLTIRVLKNDEPLAEIELPEGQLQIMRQSVVEAEVTSGSTLDQKFLTCNLALQFPNLQLNEEGSIRLRAVVDEYEVKGNGLRIRLATSHERGLLQAI